VNKLVCAECGRSWYSAATPDTLYDPSCEFCKGKLLLADPIKDSIEPEKPEKVD